jgi:lipopolysaccharide biosynthesis glycosyltransferase
MEKVMKVIVFTICSNNYLAQAKTLMNSVNRYNPEFKLYIGLADKLSDEIDYSYFLPATILQVDQLEIPGFTELIERYDIVELNTAVKPAFFKYLISNSDIIIYLDPDIKVFSNLNKIISLINDQGHEILLTPHIVTAIKEDGLKPSEQTFLSHGIYNLGFLAVSGNSYQVKDMLDWWLEKCLQNCVRDIPNGYFVDQLCMNLLPLFYECHILRGFGYNMAPWNLHERKIITKTNGHWILNDGSELVFYHFSSYDYKNPDKLCKPYYNRFSLENREDLYTLYRDYHKEVLVNRIEFYSELSYKLRKIPVLELMESPIKKPIKHKNLIRELCPPLLYNHLAYLKNRWYAKT